MPVTMSGSTESKYTVRGVLHMSLQFITNLHCNKLPLLRYDAVFSNNVRVI